MLNELEIWKSIFIEKDEEKLKYLIDMVVKDEKARCYVFDKLLFLKNKPTSKYEININLDESLMDYPIEELADKIGEHILEEIKKDIKTIS